MPFDIEWVRARLPERRIDWYPTVESTMSAAALLSAGGCPSGTAVGADEQTAGYGRQRRPWHSEPESGLYVSVVLRFAFPPGALPVVTMALGLAAAEAIFKASGVVCDLRWPNDALIGDRKCAGILTQFDGAAAIAGIGVNVNHAAFPPELRPLATSLRIATGAAHSRERLLAELLPAIDSCCAILYKDGKQPILEMFSHASSYVSGRRVCVDQGGAVLEGSTAGLTAEGYLIVRDDAGRKHVVIAGGVRPCS